MKQTWPSLATLVLSILIPGALLYWGNRDPQGEFHAEYLWANGNLGVSVFFLAPYLLLAAAALVAWRHPASLYHFVLTAVLFATVLLGAWADYMGSREAPPGRGNPPVGMALATLLLWLGSIVGLIGVCVVRALSGRRS